MFACSNNDGNIEQVIEGEYTGTFERNGKTSTIKLNFNNGKFIGESETVKFPAICSGNYNILKNTIKFNNECPWTAEFDWSLILSGEWKYSFKGHTLVLTKSDYGKYTLTKQ